MKATSEIYGLNVCELLGSYDPDSRCLKMSQDSLALTADDSSTGFLRTWPKAGMMRNGKCYRLRKSARGTGGRGSGLLRTPDTCGGGTKSKEFYEHCKKTNASSIRLQDQVRHETFLTPSTVNIEGGEDRIEKRTEYRKSIGRQYTPGSLAEQVKFHTPRAMMPIETPENFRKRMNSKSPNDRKNGYPNLAVQVMFPTPKAQNANSPAIHGTGGMDLQTAVIMPTPQARDWKGKSQRGSYGNTSDCLPNAIGGQLNPIWVSWLMGYPLLWTWNSEKSVYVWLRTYLKELTNSKDSATR